MGGGFLADSGGDEGIPIVVLGRRRGITLIELMVSMGILSGMILAAAYVFTQTSQAVELSMAGMESDASARALAEQLREDLRSLSRDGFLIISNGAEGPVDPATGKPAYRRTPMLLLTATGRFASRTQTDLAGRPITANAAVIVYTLGENAAATDFNVANPRRLLCRYAFLLAGADGSPADLTQLVQQSAVRAQQAAQAAGRPVTDLNSLDWTDVLGGSLADIRRTQPLPIANAYAKGAGERYQRINTSPDGLDDELGGGVKQLWPFVTGGVEGIRFEYCDGLSADGRTASPLGVTEWGPPAPSARANGKLFAAVAGSPCMCWTWKDPTAWPKALRVRLTMAGTNGPGSGREYEIIVRPPE